MNFQKLQNLVLNSNKEFLKSSLGYKNDAKFRDAINTFLKAKNLAEYDRKGYFDFKFSSKTLLFRLAEIFDIQIKDEFCEARKYNDERGKFVKSYVYIDTNSKL